MKYVKLNMAMILLPFTLVGCSSLNMDIWPLGKSETATTEYKPENSTTYTCDANKKFFLRMLDKGESVWIILPEREFTMARVGTGNTGTENTKYSNDISTLELNKDGANLDLSATLKYSNCIKEAIKTK